MTDHLRSALQDLAEAAPTARVSSELWQQAQLSRRRRAAGTAALAAVFALLGGLVVWGVVETGPTADVASTADYTDSDLALPDVFSRPSPWEEGTADEGPLGPLAAVGMVPDRQVSWFGTESSFFGISAITGDYRYLDLPRAGSAEDFANYISLSPDGTKLAYWIEGEPPRLTGEVRTVGYAVYDSVTGQTRLRDVARPFGISEQSLAWTGDSADVVAFYGHSLRGLGASRGETTEAFDPASSVVTPLRLPSWSIPELSTWSARSVAWFDFHKLTVMNLDTGERRTTRLSRSPWQTPVLSPDGRSAAVIAEFPQGGGTIGRLGVFDAGALAAETDVRAAPGVRTALRVIGWSADDAMLIEADGPVTNALLELDVATGVTSQVAEVSRSNEVSYAQFARDLAERPLVHRDGPASKWDPRAVVVIAGMLALGLAYVVWGKVDRRRKANAAEVFEDRAPPAEPRP